MSEIITRKQGTWEVDTDVFVVRFPDADLTLHVEAGDEIEAREIAQSRLNKLCYAAETHHWDVRRESDDDDFTLSPLKSVACVLRLALNVYAQTKTPLALELFAPVLTKWLAEAGYKVGE